MSLLLFALLLVTRRQVAPGPVVSCAWHGSPVPAQHCAFTLALATGGQEVENQYIAQEALYARVLQYLNYDIAQDVYLRLPGRPDSVAASAASYQRQYGATGRSSVLLVFPVPDKQLRHGCTLTFTGQKLALGTRRFAFSAHAIRAARQGQHPPR